MAFATGNVAVPDLQPTALTVVVVTAVTGAASAIGAVYTVPAAQLLPAQLGV